MGVKEHMQNDIPDVGQDAPNFEAVTAVNKIFRLNEELKAGRNIKLMFSRGHW